MSKGKMILLALWALLVVAMLAAQLYVITAYFCGLLVGALVYYPDE